MCLLYLCESWGKQCLLQDHWGLQAWEQIVLKRLLLAHCYRCYGVRQQAAWLSGEEIW